MREVENLKEAGSRGAGLRVLIGKRTGSSYTSDLSPEGIAPDGAVGDRTRRHHHRRSARRACPTPTSWARSPAICSSTATTSRRLETPCKIELARRAEEAALAVDPRITNSEGASFDSTPGPPRLRQLARLRRASTAPAAARSARSRWRANGESMERDYWYTMARGFAGLEEPEDVGRIAAERALRRLGARKGGDAEGPGDLRAAHRALAARQHLRSRRRRVDLSPRIVPRRQTGREDRVARTSPSSTTAPCPACSAPRRSTTKACPRAAPW